MPTKIYVANVIVGETVIEKVAVKKLPLYILCSQPEFRNNIEKWSGEKFTLRLKIRVAYLKFINYINTEPLIGEIK